MKKMTSKKIFLADIRIVCKYTDAIAEAKGFNSANKRKEKLVIFYNLVAIVENQLLPRND